MTSNAAPAPTPAPAPSQAPTTSPNLLLFVNHGTMEYTKDIIVTGEDKKIRYYLEHPVNPTSSVAASSDLILHRDSDEGPTIATIQAHTSTVRLPDGTFHPLKKTRFYSAQRVFVDSRGRQYKWKREKFLSPTFKLFEVLPTEDEVRTRIALVAKWKPVTQKMQGELAIEPAYVGEADLITATALILNTS